MGKKWRYKDPDIDCRERYYDSNDVRYNAVEYEYPEIPIRQNFRHWDTKNTQKFKEMFRKNKEKTVDHNYNEDTSSEIHDDAGDEVKLKKKKKSKKDKCSENSIEADLPNNTDVINGERKLKKKKSIKDCSENNADVSADEAINDKKAAKKKRKKKNDMLSDYGKNIKFNDENNLDPEICTDDFSPLDSIQIIKSKKKKRKKMEKEESTDLDLNTSVKIEKKKKKRKKPNDITVNVETVNIELNNNVKIEKKKKKKKLKDEISENSEASFHELKSAKTKTKKKRKLSTTNQVVEEPSISVDNTECNTKRKKKKKKVSETSCQEDKRSECEIVIDVAPENEKPSKKKKNKKRKLSETDGQIELCVKADEISVKKKKKKRHSEVEDPTNCESSPTKKMKRPNTSPDKTAVVTGQWAEVSFETDDKKDKFLRLMGGVKAAKLSDVAINSMKQPVKFNAALNKEKASMLNEGLERQFNTAIDLMTVKGKGSGFGFEKDPSQGKKFYIDSSKSKSVKFDE